MATTKLVPLKGEETLSLQPVTALPWDLSEGCSPFDKCGDTGRTRKFFPAARQTQRSIKAQAITCFGQAVESNSEWLTHCDRAIFFGVEFMPFAVQTAAAQAAIFYLPGHPESRPRDK